jgi:hypothetical protein
MAGPGFAAEIQSRQPVPEVGGFSHVCWGVALLSMKTILDWFHT